MESKSDPSGPRHVRYHTRCRCHDPAYTPARCSLSWQYRTRYSRTRSRFAASKNTSRCACCLGCHMATRSDYYASGLLRLRQCAEGRGVHARQRPRTVTIAAIPSAAGCSVRALQIAFRRFRGTTPMSALQRIRLEEARTRCCAPSAWGRLPGLPPTTASATRAGLRNSFGAHTERTHRKFWGRDVMASAEIRAERRQPPTETNRFLSRGRRMLAPTAPG